MRYTTPLWVHPKGFFNKEGDFVRTGDYTTPGVKLPNPAPSPPKPGHWRLTPNGKLKCHRTGTRQATPMWKSKLPTANLTESNASLRTRVRAAVAAGLIAAEDAPSWARPQ